MMLVTASNHSSHMPLRKLLRLARRPLCILSPTSSHAAMQSFYACECAKTSRSEPNKHQQYVSTPAINSAASNPAVFGFALFLYGMSHFTVRSVVRIPSSTSCHLQQKHPSYTSLLLNTSPFHTTALQISSSF